MELFEASSFVTGNQPDGARWTIGWTLWAHPCSGRRRESATRKLIRDRLARLHGKQHASSFYARNLTEISISEDTRNSVALMVTSPPYHVGKDMILTGTFEDYLDLLHRDVSCPEARRSSGK